MPTNVQILDFLEFLGFRIFGHANNELIGSIDNIFADVCKADETLFGQDVDSAVERLSKITNLCVTTSEFDAIKRYLFDDAVNRVDPTHAAFDKTLTHLDWRFAGGRCVDDVEDDKLKKLIPNERRMSGWKLKCAVSRGTGPFEKEVECPALDGLTKNDDGQLVVSVRMDDGKTETAVLPEGVKEGDTFTVTAKMLGVNRPPLKRRANGQGIELDENWDGAPAAALSDNEVGLLIDSLDGHVLKTRTREEMARGFGDEDEPAPEPEYVFNDRLLKLDIRGNAAVTEKAFVDPVTKKLKRGLIACTSLCEVLLDGTSVDEATKGEIEALCAARRCERPELVGMYDDVDDYFAMLVPQEQFMARIMHFSSLGPPLQDRARVMTIKLGFDQQVGQLRRLVGVKDAACEKLLLALPGQARSGHPPLAPPELDTLQYVLALVRSPARAVRCHEYES